MKTFDLTKSETAKIESRANYGVNIIIIQHPANEN